jgi:hypothetical protein
MTPKKAITPEDGHRIVRRAFRWMFLNRRTGAITVMQWPNISLSIYLALTIALRFIRPLGTTETVLRVLAGAALVVWAVDELIRGVNPFRRMLGSVVLLVTVVTFALSS